MTSSTSTRTWYRAQFEAFEKTLNGASKTSLHALRREAMEIFESGGFPTTKNEEWRFTNIAHITQTEFRLSGAHADTGNLKSVVDQHSFNTRYRLVFVNGHFAPDLSSTDAFPHGVVAGSIARSVSSNHPVVATHLAKLVDVNETPFVTLNTAFLQDGAAVIIPDNIELSDPIHLLFIASDADHALISPRNLIVVGKRSRVTIVESHVSAMELTHLTNAVTEIAVGDDSVVEHDKLQDESHLAYHVAMTKATLGVKSQFTSNTVALGGAIVRNNVSVLLGGEHSECTLNGLSLATGEQLIDNHTTIDHAKPNCESHELYKAILDGKARGVFNGKVFVRPDAQKTDAKQTNKTLLLSDEATVDTKPQLEIFADDVKCTHGATVGQLDAEQVFYLRSRGIDERAAKDILTFAFAGDVVARVHVDALRERMEALIHSRLDQGRLGRSS
jgi:Fe-S cluster assembly protein SufD